MKRIISKLILLAIIIFLGIGYYKYIYVPKGEIYDVKYLNLKTINSVGDISEKKLSLTDKGLNLRLGFTKINDSITYTFDITNDGTIPVKLIKDPIFFGTDIYFKKHIFYNLTDISDNQIKSGDVIEPGDTKKVKLQITYLKDADIVTQDSQNFETNLIFLYLQDRK